MVVARQMAKTNANPTKTYVRHGPPDRKFRGSLHPAEARLLKKGQALQDELSDRQQMQADAAESDRATLAAWRACQVSMIPVRIWCHGFWPPTNTNHPRPSSRCHRVEHLHLQWIRLLENLPKSRMLAGNISYAGHVESKQFKSNWLVHISIGGSARIQEPQLIHTQAFFEQGYACLSLIETKKSAKTKAALCRDAATENGVPPLRGLSCF
jgi:hypothetical protein